MPVIHPYHRSRVQIDTPLDFLLVADHAELMGVIKSLAEGNEALAKIPIGRRYIEWIQAGRESDVYNEMLNRGDDPNNVPVLKLNTESVRSTMWGEIIDAAERHNEPGKFTTLLG